ncbi:MAG: CRISPR-associated endonuclease Cas4g/Cas1g [Terriglobales bacterium]
MASQYPAPARPGGDEHHLGLPEPELLPARMLNEFVYCPRLFYYEWVEKVFLPSTDTLEGRARHRRVEAPADALPAPQTPGQGPSPIETERIHSRSIELSSPRLGLIARMDLIESAAGDAEVTPVDYKKGRPRDGDAGPEPWPADRAQVLAQALILRDNGYHCREAVLFYAATRQRVPVPLDDAAEVEVIAQLAAARVAAASPAIPPPLEDSPKCPRCSLVGICLPDETNALRGRDDALEDSAAPPLQLPLFDGVPARRFRVRPLLVPRDDLRPVYLNTQGWRVGVSGGVLQVRGPAEGGRKGRGASAWKDELKQEARLGEVCQVNLFGGVQVSTQAVQTLCQAEIPICYFSQGGYFYGITTALNSRNVFLRRTQLLAAENPALCLALARRLVAGKIRNQRTLLQRNHLQPPAQTLRLLRALAAQALAAPSLDSLLGTEGAAAHAYFGAFAGMLKSRDEDAPEGAGTAAPAMDFDFHGRNRRPPRDPVNALLSLAYSLLAKDCVIACYALGLEPFWGFYHQPRFGRPALALDLMEPFRPLIADSAVLTAINTAMVTPADFVRTGQAVALRPQGRAAFYRAYEQRINDLATHPLFEYRVSYRRLLEIQARLLARFLTAEIHEYPVFITR